MERAEADRRHRPVLAGTGFPVGSPQADLGRPGPTHRKSAYRRGLVLTLPARCGRSRATALRSPMTCLLSHCRWTDYAAPTSLNPDGGGMTRANLHRIGKILFGIVW